MSAAMSLATLARLSPFRSHLKLLPYVASIQPVRTLWGYLNAVANQVDPDRIKEVGPDRACAEWLLRCGASVKWKDKNYWQQDYNTLPASRFELYKIEEIDATSSTIMAVGFQHLKDLKHVRKIILHDCQYLYDDALEYLELVKDTLVFLQLSNCGDITDRGLPALTKLVNLKDLIMFALPEVRDRVGVTQMLKAALPNCNVQFTEARVTKTTDEEKHT